MANSRREFLKSAGAALVVAGVMRRALDAAGFDPLEKNIRELQRAMAAGQVTSAQLVQFYIDRITAYDQVGPRLNAVIAINPNAAAYARALDDERRKKGPRGPRHGIPVLLKDNFDTNDMPTPGGALALTGIVVYLGDYLKKSGGPVASVEELPASGLHVAQLEGILNIANRTGSNGGVAYILAKSPAAKIAGTVMLSEQEATDLKAGKLYVAVISRTSPRLSARADLVLPPA